MPLDNQLLTNKASLYSLLNTLKDVINYNLNCVKIATVESFDSEKMTVCCRVNNKRLVQLKENGNQILRDYPQIYAKVHFFGWGDIGATYPISAGMEGILLFNDRELETWFLTSEGGNLAYDRCHDLSDAIFICGLHSQPKIELVPYLEDCLNLFYKASSIQIKNESVIINGNTTINGNLQVNGTINATGDIIAGSISLQHHTHGGVEVGTKNTGEPQ